MKVTVFEETEKEKEVQLKLIKRTDRVDLVAVDAFGESLEGGNILSIHNNGKLRLFSSVNSKIGLELTPGGRIEIDD